MDNSGTHRDPIAKLGNELKPSESLSLVFTTNPLIFLIKRVTNMLNNLISYVVLFQFNGGGAALSSQTLNLSFTLLIFHMQTPHKAHNKRNTSRRGGGMGRET